MSELYRRQANEAIRLLRRCEKQRDALLNVLAEVMRIAGHHVGTRIQEDAERALNAHRIAAENGE